MNLDISVDFRQVITVAEQLGYKGVKVAGLNDRNGNQRILFVDLKNKKLFTTYVYNTGSKELQSYFQSFGYFKNSSKDMRQMVNHLEEWDGFQLVDFKDWEA